MDESSDGGIPESLASMIDRVREVLTPERVVGQPIERDGVTVVPVVSVRGGGGGGSGEGGPAGAGAGSRSGQSGSGTGMGFGVMAHPVGAYVVRDGSVQWIPAVDPARMALLAIVMAFLVSRAVTSITKQRAKRRGR